MYIHHSKSTIEENPRKSISGRAPCILHRACGTSWSVWAPCIAVLHLPSHWISPIQGTTHPVTQICRIYQGHPKTTLKLDPLPNGHFNCLGAKPRPKRLLLGAISATIWGQAEHEKIVLSCGFWQGSEGWRHSQIDEFSEMFCACFSRAI